MDTKNKILLISRISLWVIAITAIVISIRAINIAKKRPITYEQIMIQSHDIDFTPDLTFAGVFVPFVMFYLRERYDRELLSNCYIHSNTKLLLKRAKRWFPVIEPILEKYNIPDDFKYLCLVESGLTNAKSPAGAVGFWQFMPATAKEYGLTINKEIDMRYSVEAETVAACKYFQKAYKRFNNWTLAAASLKAGAWRIAMSL